MVPDKELTRRVTRFLERLRYRIPLEYLLVNEWREGHRHMHILVRADTHVTPDLVADLWSKVNPGPRSICTSYCRPVDDPIKIARYIVKDLKDAAKKEVAPKSYEGRVMTYSRRFLAKSMKKLWRELVDDWLAHANPVFKAGRDA
jgi:hypothetical protein